MMLNILRDGYVLLFTCIPAPSKEKNHASINPHIEFVRHELAGLVKRGCVKVVKESDVVVFSPLGVVDNGRKLRLILDLWYVNKHLAKFKFKLEDLKVVASVYDKGDYVVTFDLKSGYHRISIAKEHWKYLGFSVQDTAGFAKSYVICVLPFGLSTAPYIFTKVTHVLLRYWRAEGMRCQMYMDDGSGGAASVEEAETVASRMRSDLAKAGFLPNEKKCRWTPSQVVEMLGMKIDLAEGKIWVTEDRVRKLKCLLGILSRKAFPTAKELARLCGFFAFYVNGPWASLPTSNSCILCYDS